jgi:U3 small nucleolar RNA-associated protein 13
MRIYALVLSKDGSLEARLLRTLKPHLAPVIVSVTDDSGTLLATGGADGVVKVWDIRGGFITHTFHGHSGVISALHFFQVHVDPSKSIDEAKSRKTKKRKPSNDEEFEENEALETLGYRLASGGEDGKVRVWNLHKQRASSAAIASLDSHVSVLRKICYCAEENALLSAGRDRTVIVWDTRTWKIRLTIPVLEEVEAAGFLANGSIIYSGDETARLRLWATDSGREITKPQKEGTEIEGVQDAIYLKDLECLLLVQADQTLCFYDTKSLSVPEADTQIDPLQPVKRICGTHDQVVDIAYVGPPARGLLALATNSEDLRIINTASPKADAEMDSGLFESTYFGADYAILKGHADVIICMDVNWSGNWVLTGAKDNAARLWRLDLETDSQECYAVLTGHAESVSAVALPHYSTSSSSPSRQPPEYLVTGSGDKTIKRWTFSKSKTGSNEKVTPRAVYTRKAHDKDINALAIHPTGRFFASASLDKTVKIWDAEEGSTVGVLRGHRRGVWSVVFSPLNVHIDGGAGTGSSIMKGYAATGAADRTVRVWNLADFSCLVTLEGHNGGVLKVVWLPPAVFDKDAEGSSRGPMVASAAADGLVKVWDVKKGECETTLDNHTDRVWALTVPPNSDSKKNEPVLVSGGADAVITFWKDTTTQTTQLALEAESRRLETDQRLENLVHTKSYRDAISLALSLDRPGMLFELFKNAYNDGKAGKHGTSEQTFTGLKQVDDALGDLSDGQLFKLLVRLRDWNANARKSLVAQRVLRCLVDKYDMEKVSNLKPWVAKKNDEDGDDNDSDKKTRTSGKGLSGNVTLVEVIDGLRTWTERHHSRAVELWDESFLVEFTLREMDSLELDDVDAGHATNGTLKLANGQVDVEMED